MSSTEINKSDSNNQNTSQNKESTAMEKINSTILKTALEAIPKLTSDNYTIWRNLVDNMLDVQGLRDALTSSTGTLTDSQDVHLRTIITSKLDSSIHPNVITHENEKNARKIWKSITEYFASTQPANRARVFNELLDLSFNSSDVQSFITSVRTVNSRLFEIGIDIPQDLVAYIILKKLPALLTNVSQQITHSDKPLTTTLVLDHLKLYSNDQAATANRGSGSRSDPIALYSDASKKCKKTAHNVLSNHPEAKCWMLYPHLRPASENKNNRSESMVSSFHSSFSQSSSQFILDSGSSAHMVSNINLFFALDRTEKGLVHTSSGKDSLQIKGSGSIKLINEFGSLILHHVLFVPDLVVNLLSVRCLVLDDYIVEFFKNSFSILKHGKMKMNGHYTSNLPSLSFANVEHQSHFSSAESLHRSLGHVSYHRLRQKLGIPLKNEKICEACSLAKITRASFKSKHPPASKPFEEIHLDLIGPISPCSREGHRYILTVVDSHTRFCSAIPIKAKSEVASVLSDSISLEAKRFGYYPSVIHSDRGTEFLNKSMKEFCIEHLIRTRTSDPYTPQQNGLAERHNRTILESLRTILKDSGFSHKYWSNIVKVSTLTLNQIPAHKSKKSPFEMFKNRSIPIDFFRPIGNRVSYLILPQKSASKLMPKGELGMLIGYNDEIQSYRILSDNGKIIETKSARFLDQMKESEDEEDEVFEIIVDNIQSEEIDEEDSIVPTEETESVDEVLASKVPIEIESDSSSDSSSESSDSSDDDIEDNLVPKSLTPRKLRDRTSKVKPSKYSYLSTDPSSFKKAMSSLDKDKWTTAANEELSNIEGHEVWDDMWTRPESFLHTLWIFKTKPATLSSQERKKARLCIQGFAQLPEECGNTFAPTGKFTTLLMLLMFAVDKKLTLRQFDVKSTFLYAPLKEEVYIKTPEGSDQKAPYLKLKKSLYGLKQAPANWCDTLTQWLESINYHQSTSDPCLYIHKERRSFIFFHVDDLIVVGNVEIFESLFMNQFPNSTAHDPDSLLGMEVCLEEGSIRLSQPKLIEKGLEMLKLTDCRPVKTPLSVAVQLKQATEEEKTEFQKLNINYRSFTGILNFLACRTCPDLAPAVSILSSFNHAPGITHWKEVIHCWKYLAGTSELSLNLTPDSTDQSKTLEYYTDATWADDLETRLSRSGTICFWKSCPVSWSSKKQKNITLSSTEAEMNALSDSAQENQWITYLVEELWKEKLNPTDFHVDNQGLVEKIKNFGSNSKTKHLDIKGKWLRDLKTSNQINVRLIPSEEMIADALTKASNHKSLQRLKERCFLVLLSPN
jgi:transposase InsO family protein